MEQVGKQLFGRALRLRVLVWVATQDEPFYQAGAAAAVGYSSVTAVATELNRLVVLRMLKVVEPEKKTKRRYYMRQDHPFWDAIRLIAANVAP